MDSRTSRWLPFANGRARITRPGAVVGLMLGALLVSALAVVFLQHHVRHMETQLAQAMEAQQALMHEQGRLRLEKHHLTALARVEQIAKQQLGLHHRRQGPSQPAQVIVLSPNP